MVLADTPTGVQPINPLPATFTEKDKVCEYEHSRELITPEANHCKSYETHVCIHSIFKRNLTLKQAAK